MYDKIKELKEKRFVAVKLQEPKIASKRDMVGKTKFAIVLRYRGWSVSFDKDRDEYSIMDMVDFIETQVLAKPHGKAAIANDEDGESDHEDDDEFEGETTGSDGLETIESDGKKRPPTGKPIGKPGKVQLTNPTQVASTSTTLYVASTQPRNNNNQGNLDTSSTPLSRTTIATVEKTNTKKRPHNASSSQELSSMSLDELGAVVLKTKLRLKKFKKA
ncbi:hypothetical protein Cgig2_016401 [Carnegiea gigantea]|uniref:Uncharacterized protein n=1 Tax=Carnegiea gigantea TaxID=171969 RepID=A0A9Q1K947_9CARY|nr:hypothetical protein Cgig2_016401 [Carnegiea gigantea]